MPGSSKLWLWLIGRSSFLTYTGVSLCSVLSFSCYTDRVLGRRMKIWRIIPHLKTSGCSCLCRERKKAFSQAGVFGKIIGFDSERAPCEEDLAPSSPKSSVTDSRVAPIFGLLSRSHTCNCSHLLENDPSWQRKKILIDSCDGTIMKKSSTQVRRLWELLRSLRWLGKGHIWRKTARGTSCSGVVGVIKLAMPSAPVY
jgi:hypothetical protein